MFKLFYIFNISILKYKYLYINICLYATYYHNNPCPHGRQDIQTQDHETETFISFCWWETEAQGNNLIFTRMSGSSLINFFLFNR